MRWFPFLLVGLGLACESSPNDELDAQESSTTMTQLSTSTSPALSDSSGSLTTQTSSSSTGFVDSTEGEGELTEGSTGAPTCLELPNTQPEWITPLQEELVAQLTGSTPLPSGITLTDRASMDRRAATLDFVEQQWESLGLNPLRHEYSNSGTNLYAVIPATEAAEATVVVGAHFDSVPRCPGANDNATGIAMVTSLGRWLNELPCRRRDVILVVFDEEEIGLVGSQAFAQWLTTQPFEVHSVHTIDQMGWDSDGDRAIELERADEGLFELYEQAEPWAPGMTPLTPTTTGSTDHVSFRELGFAAIGITEEYVSGDTTPHYHLPSDTLETVNFEYLSSSTALVHATIGRLVAPEP